MKERTPYKYLDYYTFEDADLFFGREEETQKMVGEILSTPLLVLFSPSGSGKTSLINAGVRPALEKLGYKTIYVRLDKDPISSVRDKTAEELKLPTDNQPKDLHGFLQQAVAKAGKPLVIFIDQFEEFFIVFEDKGRLRQEFIQQAAKIKYDDSLPVFLVISLREDYFVNLHEFREAIPSIFQNNANIRLEPFTEEEARRAIIKPAKAVGGGFQEELVERLLKDLKDGKPGIEPITLQIVCYTLWRKKSETAPRITLDDYEISGGAEHIIRDQVEQRLSLIPWQQQRLLARVLEALKTPDDTKRYRSFEDLRQSLNVINPGRLHKLLDRLVELDLLRQESLGGTTWYEFKHDYLVGEITRWLQWRKERINRRWRIYGVTPGLLILLGWLAYLFYLFNSFYVDFINPEYETQQEEIAIFRKWNPFQEVITTGLLREDVRDLKAANEIKKEFALGFWKREDWRLLAESLKPVAGGKFLYRLGHAQAGIDTLFAALKDPNPNVCYQAAAALVNLGKSDSRITTTLVVALEDQNANIRYQIAAALANLSHGDDRIISALDAVLQDQDSSVRSQAAVALAHLGKSDVSTISVLVAALKDQDSSVRSQAVAALVHLGEGDDHVIAALKDQDSNARSQAAAVLGNLGHSNDRAIAALVIALKDQDSSVRSQAAAALVNLGTSDDRIISALVAALQEQNSSVRSQAAAALANSGISDDRVLSALVATLQDQDSSVCSQAAAALVTLGKSDDRVIDALVVTLKDQDWQARSQAAAALGNLGKSDDRVISALVAALADDYRDITYGNFPVRSHAAAALANLGHSDGSVFAALMVALNDREWYVRSQAAAALGNLGYSGDRVLAVLVNALKDPGYNVRSQAATTLKNLSHSDDRAQADKVISALVAALKDQDPDTRSPAAAVLGNLGRNHEPVFDAIIAALTDKDWPVRLQAAAALGSLLHTEPIDKLFKRLESRFSGERIAGAQALARQDSIAQTTLAEIIRRREDERPWVRLGAWEAYDLIQARLKSEQKAAQFQRQADSLFASGRLLLAANQYGAAFDILQNIVRVDSAKTASAKFQQARCEAKLEKNIAALNALKSAFQYQKSLRDILQEEMAKPENDWKVLEGNWYLREVLLKK